MQLPLPLQVEVAARFVFPLHVGGAHTVPATCRAQAPAPLQVPFVPHVDAAVTAQTPRGSSVPAGTGAQLPAEPATAHDVQLGQLATPQHTPSTQWPFTH